MTRPHTKKKKSDRAHIDDGQLYELISWLKVNYQEAGALPQPLPDIVKRAQLDLGFSVPQQRLGRLCRLYEIKTSRVVGGQAGTKRVLAHFGERIVELEERITALEEELTSCRESEESSFFNQVPG